jgi:hypothetical protein
VSAHNVIVLAMKNADTCIADREGVQYPFIGSAGVGKVR